MSDQSTTPPEGMTIDELQLLKDENAEQAALIRNLREMMRKTHNQVIQLTRELNAERSKVIAPDGNADTAARDVYQSRDHALDQVRDLHAKLQEERKESARLGKQAADIYEELNELAMDAVRLSTPFNAEQGHSPGVAIENLIRLAMLVNFAHERVEQMLDITPEE